MNNLGFIEKLLDGVEVEWTRPNMTLGGITPKQKLHQHLLTHPTMKYC